MGHKAGRNQRCQCGCGKKIRNCPNGGRKPVISTATAEFAQPTKLEAYTLGPGGPIDLIADGAVRAPARAWAEQFYKRPTKPKVLTRMPTDVMRLRTGDFSEFAMYRNIFSVDTNSPRELRDQAISLCAFGVAEVIADPPRGDVFRGRPAGIFEFSQCTGEPERLGWWLTQQAILNSPNYDPNARYAIVSDHDIRIHNAINAREEPLFGDAYLADNIDLLYATADAGRDALNVAIKNCDDRANEYASAIVSGEVDHSQAPAVAEGPCARFGLCIIPNERELVKDFEFQLFIPEGFRISAPEP